MKPMYLNTNNLRYIINLGSILEDTSTLLINLRRYSLFFVIIKIIQLLSKILSILCPRGYLTLKIAIVST